MLSSEAVPDALTHSARTILALRVKLKGKLLCVYLKFLPLKCNAKYRLYLKGVSYAEGVLLSLALCSDLLGIPSLGSAAQPLNTKYVSICSTNSTNFVDWLAAHISSGSVSAQ